MNSDNNTSSNSDKIFELIQSIQSKLSDDTNEEKVSQNDKQENTNKSTNTENSNVDFSKVSSILNNLNTSNKENTNENSYFNLDADTILKIQKIMKNLNKNDPRKNLLLSLKPFLRKSRQDKINEYVTILSITDALGILGNKGSD